MVNHSVRQLVKKIEEISSDLEHLRITYNKYVKEKRMGLANTCKVRITMRNQAGKHYAELLRDKGKGNVVTIVFRHTFRKYTATFTNITQLDAQELIYLKYGQNVNFLEIKDIPTQIKEA